MAEYKHIETGVKVSVADHKVLGPEWEPIEDEKPRTSRAKKSE